MGEITLIVEFAIKPGKTEDFREASARMRAAVQAREPGTTRYDWWLSEDGTRDFNIEVFADSDALAAHMENTASLVGDLTDAADVVRVEVLGELTETGHRAIDAAATGHFGLLGGVER